MGRLHRPNGGFTLLELMMSLAILAGLLGLFAVSLETTAKDDANQAHLAVIRRDGQEVLKEIKQLLTRSQVVAGFPETFADGDITATFPALASGTAHAVPGHPPSREIAFLNPSDSDGDGWFDTDAYGAILWSATPSAIVIDGGPDGANRIRFIDSSGAVRLLSRRATALEIDDSASTGFTIPLNTLRIRVHYSRDPLHQDSGLSPETFETLISLSKDKTLP